MSCPHCGNPVNVAFAGGVRCGCGKTVHPSEPARAIPTAGELERLLTLMREYRALRVKSGDLEVELSTEAFAPSWPAQSGTHVDTPEKSCRCGHGGHAHNEEGLCLEGCDAEACAEKAAA